MKRNQITNWIKPLALTATLAAATSLMAQVPPPTPPGATGPATIPTQPAQPATPAASEPQTTAPQAPMSAPTPAPSPTPAPAPRARTSTTINRMYVFGSGSYLGVETRDIDSQRAKEL